MFHFNIYVSFLDCTISSLEGTTFLYYQAPTYLGFIFFYFLRLTRLRLVRGFFSLEKFFLLERLSIACYIAFLLTRLQFSFPFSPFAIFFGFFLKRTHALCIPSSHQSFIFFPPINPFLYIPEFSVFSFSDTITSCCEFRYS